MTKSKSQIAIMIGGHVEVFGTHYGANHQPRENWTLVDNFKTAIPDLVSPEERDCVVNLDASRASVTAAQTNQPSNQE